MFLALYFGAVIVFAVTVFMLIWWYQRLQYSTKASLSWIPLSLMVILAPIVGFLTVLSFAGGFGPGALLYVGSLPISFIVLAYGLTIKRPNHIAGGHSLRWARKLIIVGCFLIFSLSPFIGFKTITKGCFAINTRQAQPIIDALNEYKAAHETYPEDLDALSPQYIQELPTPICVPPLAYLLDSNDGLDYIYYYEWCQNEKPIPIVWMYSIEGGFPQRHNLQTREWSNISFLDGVCSFL